MLFCSYFSYLKSFFLSQQLVRGLHNIKSSQVVQQGMSGVHELTKFFCFLVKGKNLERCAGTSPSLDRLNESNLYALPAAVGF